MRLEMGPIGYSTQATARVLTFILVKWETTSLQVLAVWISLGLT